LGAENSYRLTVAENVAGQGRVYKKRLKSQGREERDGRRKE